MGVCGCTDTKSRQGQKNIIGGVRNSNNLEGGDKQSSHSMAFEELSNRPVMKQRDMNLNHNEFRRQLSTKFKDHAVLQENCQLIKYRPELAPYYIYNVQSNYELGPGPGRATQAQRKTNQRETLQIMSNINFQQLGKNTSGVQQPQPRSSSHDDSQLNRSISSNASSIRFQFKDDLIRAKQSERLKIRNLTPIEYHKNSSMLGLWIDQSNHYWKGKKQGPLQRENIDRMVPNIIRKNRLLCTKQEYDASKIIMRNYKSFRFRKHIHARIMKKRILIFHKKKLIKGGKGLQINRQRSASRARGDGTFSPKVGIEKRDGRRGSKVGGSKIGQLSQAGDSDAESALRGKNDGEQSEDGRFSVNSQMFYMESRATGHGTLGGKDLNKET